MTLFLRFFEGSKRKDLWYKTAFTLVSFFVDTKNDVGCSGTEVSQTHPHLK